MRHTPHMYMSRRALVTSATALVPLALLPLLGCSASHADSPSTRRLRGIALPSGPGHDYGNQMATTYLREIADTGAQWVTFTPTWYQSAIGASGPRTTEKTPDDASLTRVIKLAHDAGLKVMLKPHIDLTDGSYRGTIRPDDPDAWFASYERFIVHYARMAKDLAVDQFSVGTELSSTTGDSARWRRVIAAVRDAYGGSLVYAANFDEYDRITFWDALDLIGVDAYWPLAKSPTTDWHALRSAWQPIVRELAAFSAEHERRVLFTEAGYASQQGTTTAPYSWTVSETPAPAEQGAAYEALLSAFDGKDWWAGVCWWTWDDWKVDGEAPRRLGYTPRGKPAERVLRRWWT